MAYVTSLPGQTFEDAFAEEFDPVPNPAPRQQRVHPQHPGNVNQQHIGYPSRPPRQVVAPPPRPAVNAWPSQIYNVHRPPPPINIVYPHADVPTSNVIPSASYRASNDQCCNWKACGITAIVIAVVIVLAGSGVGIYFGLKNSNTNTPAWISEDTIARPTIPCEAWANIYGSKRVGTAGRNVINILINIAEMLNLDVSGDDVQTLHNLLDFETFVTALNESEFDTIFDLFDTDDDEITDLLEGIFSLDHIHWNIDNFVNWGYTHDEDLSYFWGTIESELGYGHHGNHGNGNSGNNGNGHYDFEDWEWGLGNWHNDDDLELPGNSWDEYAICY